MISEYDGILVYARNGWWHWIYGPVAQCDNHEIETVGFSREAHSTALAAFMAAAQAMKERQQA